MNIFIDYINDFIVRAIVNFLIEAMGVIRHSSRCIFMILYMMLAIDGPGFRFRQKPDETGIFAGFRLILE